MFKGGWGGWAAVGGGGRLMHINQFDMGIRIESVFLKGRKERIGRGGGGRVNSVASVS